MMCEQAKGLISAYQDGELTEAVRKDLEVHLNDCPECMKAYRQNLALSEQIRAQAPTYAPPESLLKGKLKPRVERVSWQPFAGGLSLGLAAMLAVLVFIRPTSGDFTADLVGDHVRSLMATHLVDVVSSDRHTVKPWFLGKIDFAPKVPELRSQGFPLLGGRLDYVGGHQAAALVYGKQKHVINVLVMPSSEGAFAQGEANGYRIQHWRDGDLGYWAVSDVSRDDLISFANAFRATP